MKVRPPNAAEAKEFGLSDAQLQQAKESEVEVDLIWRTAEGHDLEGPEPAPLLGEPGARIATEIEPGSYYRRIQLQEPIQADEELHLYVRVRRTLRWTEPRQGGSTWTAEAQFRVLAAGKD